MVKIIHEYNPSKLDNKLINVICKKVKLSEIGKNYDFRYHTQKYELKEIITKIFYVLYKAKNWRQLGNCWNNVYKHYIKINLLKIFSELYTDLLQKYLKKNKVSLKITSIDTTFVYNKYGIDNLERNKYAKNKKCYKLLVLIDSKKKPIFFKYFTGNVNDTKTLTNSLDEIFEIIEEKCKIFLADSGFCSKEVRNKFKKHNILPLIPKNIRNTKKDFKMKDLPYAERLDIVFEDFSRDEREIYKKRIGIENFFANYKQPTKLNMRYEKYFENLMGFVNIYMSRLLL
jgi:hypothetical protein